MAIAIQLTFHGPGGRLENYDNSVADMGGTPGGPHPDPACLFHWAAGMGRVSRGRLFPTKRRSRRSTGE